MISAGIYLPILKLCDNFFEEMAKSKRKIVLTNSLHFRMDLVKGFVQLNPFFEIYKIRVLCVIIS